jgi:hypothetical protein
MCDIAHDEGAIELGRGRAISQPSIFIGVIGAPGRN